MRTRIKFCGCTTPADARGAVACGVDAVGVIFAAASPRCVSLETARQIAAVVPAYVELVGVFVDPSIAELESARALGFIPQVNGGASPLALACAAQGRYLHVFHLRPGDAGRLDADALVREDATAPTATWMFDTAVAGQAGGTGRSFDWNVVRTIAGARPVVIGGGLTATNVGPCVRAIRPFGVDVRSGIETDGVKDHAKMRAFVRAVKEADAQT